MKCDEPYVLHILDAIASVKKYCCGKDKKGFLADEMLKDAVVRKLEVIGEASKKLSKEFKARTASAPWPAIAGMRDRLIHGYAGVDYEIVWKAVDGDLPALESALKKALKE